MSACSSLDDIVPAGAGVRHVPVEYLPEDGALFPDEVGLADGMTIFWWRNRAVGHVIVRDGVVEARELPSRDQVMQADAAAAGPVDPVDPRSRMVSVVICTRDRPDELARCLASLPNQTRPPGEIIVVDNASRDDRTRQVAQAAGVRYVRENRPGLDFARNAGARAASGDIIAYTDDDVVLHPLWLERLVAAFDDPVIGAVTGLVLPAELETEAQRHFERHWSFGQGYVAKDFTPAVFERHRRFPFPAWEVGAGASMAFRRETFAIVGYFDERLDVGQAGCSGDSEYWYRIVAHGLVCRYAPDSIAFHYHRKTMEGLSSQLYHYMRGHAAALLVQFERTRKWGNLYRALVTMPAWYIARALRVLAGRGTDRDRFLWQETRGYLSGLAFYLRARRPG